MRRIPLLTEISMYTFIAICIFFPHPFRKCTLSRGDNRKSQRDKGALGTNTFQFIFIKQKFEFDASRIVEE